MTSTPLRCRPRPAHAPRGCRPAIRLSALALALAPLWAAAAEPAAALEQQLRTVLERLHKLEQRNQELERKVQELGAARGAAATEPQWGAAREQRLQAVEAQQQNLSLQMQGVAEAHASGDDGGPVVEGSVVSVWQRVNRGGSDDGRSQSRLNFRGDLTVELPAGDIGRASGTAVGHLRFGQGSGIGLRPTHTGTANSTTFEGAAGSDETYAIVAEAYYRLDIALDEGRFNDLPGTRATLHLGKLDFFTLFDQNEVAGDEAAQFLNNVFVHNPLLDSGGDIAADSYGFAPGVRAGYFHEGEDYGWGVSLGAFGAGEGARFNGGQGRPLVIAQLEFAPRQINGEARGNYRVYAWTNGRTSDLEGNEERHTGFGLSVDQKVGREWNLFGRYGKRSTGSGAFDQALTAGFEHGGRLWGRAHDAVGAAYALLDTSAEWRRYTADGSAAGYAASGRERVFELYYRFKVNEQLELAPDFQLIRRAGGDGGAPTTRIVGLRGTLGF